MSNIFKKDDIQAGYLLCVKDTETGGVFNMTVVPSSACTIPYRYEGELACCAPRVHWWPLSKFDNKLEYKRMQVVTVYGRTNPMQLLDNTTEDRALLWQREETKPEPKKMTAAEIAKALGYPVEIVAE